MNRIVTCRIDGISPLLMHRYLMEPIEAIEKKPAAEQAEYSAYRVDGKGLYVPGQAFQRALVGGASYVKGKGRSTMAKPVAACVLIMDEYLLLGVDKYEIDARAVRIPSTGGRIVRYRPRLNTWGFEVEFHFDDSLLSEVQMRAVVDATGSRVGLLDFRPEKKGPFGRFVVNKWGID